jgi:hypothetical protein
MLLDGAISDWFLEAGLKYHHHHHQVSIMSLLGLYSKFIYINIYDRPSRMRIWLFQIIGLRNSGILVQNFNNSLKKILNHNPGINVY